MKKTYVPPYKFKRPTTPANSYDVVCPYFASSSKNIQFDFQPIRFAKPRMKQQQQLRAGTK